MKLNLSSSELNSYKNLSKDELDSVYDGQCSEIYAPDFLDKVTLAECKPLMLKLCKKLEHGGKIILGGIDLIEFMKNVQNYTINVEDFNIIVYNECRQGTFTLNDTVENLVDFGLKIIRKQLNGYNFLIEAKRP